MTSITLRGVRLALPSGHCRKIPPRDGNSNVDAEDRRDLSTPASQPRSPPAPTRYADGVHPV